MSAEESPLLAAMDRIGLDVVTKRRESCVFSPLLTVLSSGALVFVGFSNDEPRKSILKWLGFDLETSNAMFAEALKQIMSTLKEDPSNALYFQMTRAPNAEVSVDSSALEQYLGVPVLVADPASAARHINKAVAAATDDWIPELVDEQMCSGPIVIANANHFLGHWKHEMQKECSFQWELPDSSHNGWFIGAEATFKIAMIRSYIYIEIPYENSGVLEIYMTDDRSRLPLDLTHDDMDALRAEAKPCDVTVYIPDWKEKTMINIAEVLANEHVCHLGEFHDLGQIVQKTTIRVSLMWTVASSGMSMGSGCLDCFGDPRIPDSIIKVNRPFLYAIRSASITLYMGYVYDIKHLEE